MMMKGIKDEINAWTDILCSWTGKHNMTKVSVPPKVTCRSKKSLTKSQQDSS